MNGSITYNKYLRPHKKLCLIFAAIYTYIFVPNTITSEGIVLKPWARHTTLHFRKAYFYTVIKRFSTKIQIDACKQARINSVNHNAFCAKTSPYRVAHICDTDASSQHTYENGIWSESIFSSHVTQMSAEKFLCSKNHSTEPLNV